MDPEVQTSSNQIEKPFISTDVISPDQPTAEFSEHFQLMEHLIVPFKKMHDESDVQAMERILLDRAVKGWEIVDVCGDEVRSPVLIFKKLLDHTSLPVYQVEEIKHLKGQEEIQTVSDRLWDKLQDDWLPCCVLDSLFSLPLAVFKKCKNSCADVRLKLVAVPIGMFERTVTSITYELLDQQIKNNFTLMCVMHGGLNPVLIFCSKDDDKPYEYLVEHAEGGLFSNMSKTLSSLIDDKNKEGFEVCGSFEDSYLFPCVIFRRATNALPVAPIEIVHQSQVGLLDESVNTVATIENVHQQTQAS